MTAPAMGSCKPMHGSLNIPLLYLFILFHNTVCDYSALLYVIQTKKCVLREKHEILQRLHYFSNKFMLQVMILEIFHNEVHYCVRYYFVREPTSSVPFSMPHLWEHCIKRDTRTEFCCR